MRAVRMEESSNEECRYKYSASVLRKQQKRQEITYLTRSFSICSFIVGVACRSVHVGRVEGGQSQRCRSSGCHVLVASPFTASVDPLKIPDILENALVYLFRGRLAGEQTGHQLNPCRPIFMIVDPIELEIDQGIRMEHSILFLCRCSVPEGGCIHWRWTSGNQGGARMSRTDWEIACSE